jgi:hypothetical protein
VDFVAMSWVSDDVAGSGGWKHRCCVLAIVLVGSLVVGCGSSDTTAEVSKAARAPYIAVVGRDARALCADFTPETANHLARDISRSASCDERVAEVFARSDRFEPKSQPVAPKIFRTSRVMQHGDVAYAAITYGADGSGVRVTLELARIGGAWRVATPPMLRLVSGCFVRGLLTTSCPKNARVMLFSIGRPELQSGQSEPPGASGQQLVPVPSVVEGTGGRELREFNAGMKVAAQAGCLACHRIGDQGNSGPGPTLTQVGSKLSARQIEHALVVSSAPMPSFKNMPAAKLKALVQFLALLR